MVCPLSIGAMAKEKPRLILQITVDQMRGDIPTRYFNRLGEGGLRYLLEDGIHYDNAHHAHANTETIVGHVTLATGAHPAAHGMVGNLWFDRVDGRVAYNIEDSDYRLLTEGAGVDAEIANAVPGPVRLCTDPVACQFQPVGKQVDVKAIALT